MPHEFEFSVSVSVDDRDGEDFEELSPKEEGALEQHLMNVLGAVDGEVEVRGHSFGLSAEVNAV